MNSNIFRECKIIYLSQKPSFLALEEGTCIQKASENPFVEVEGWEQLFKENSLDRTLLKA